MRQLVLNTRDNGLKTIKHVNAHWRTWRHYVEATEHYRQPGEILVAVDIAATQIQLSFERKL